MAVTFKQSWICCLVNRLLSLDWSAARRCFILEVRNSALCWLILAVAVWFQALWIGGGGGSLNHLPRLLLHQSTTRVPLGGVRKRPCKLVMVNTCLVDNDCVTTKQAIDKLINTSLKKWCASVWENESYAWSFTDTRFSWPLRVGQALIIYAYAWGTCRRSFCSSY